MRRPDVKVPGHRATGDRATRQGKATSSFQSTPTHPTASRVVRRPFPALSFRLYYHWPAGLAVAVGLPWQAGRREAA